jgi:GAF domain-containing protein
MGGFLHEQCMSEILVTSRESRALEAGSVEANTTSVEANATSVEANTTSVEANTTSVEANTTLVEALTSLNEIGAAINQLTPRGDISLAATLRLVIANVTRFVQGSAAVIYTYDAAEQVLSPRSRLSAGELPPDADLNAPRPGGLGMRALRQRHRILSYEEPGTGTRSQVGTRPPLAAPDGRVTGCFPLVVAGKPVGLLYVHLREARRFGEFELLMIDNLANHAAMAIYQANRLSDVERDLVRTEEALNRLWRAGMLISSRLGLDETLEAILEMALDVTGAHYGIFRLVDEGGATLVTRAIAGASGRPQVEALPIDGNSIMGWVAAHRRPLCIHDLEAAPWVRLYHPLDADLRMRSELAVPLVGSSGRLEGVLNLESPMIGAFSDQDRHLLQSLATQAVIAIQEARLLDTLLEVAHLLLAEPQQQVLQHLVTQATNLLDAAASAIWIPDGDELVLQATTGALQRGDRLPLHASLTGEAVLEQRVIISEDVREDPRFHSVALARTQAWNRALIVPLLSSQGGAALGAFSVYGVEGESGRFTESEWDRKVLTCLAYYAALALQNAERHRALRLAEERHSVAETFAAIGDVAANVLHHLNNKVGTIPVRVQGIQDKCGVALQADSYLASNLAEIEHSAREAMDAVRDSLAYLRPIHASPVTIAACVTAALEDTRVSAGLQVALAGLDDLPPVVASERSLIFVFANLLENSRAAMQGMGTIHIAGTASSHWVEVEITDDGPGISPDLHERIFEFNTGEPDAQQSGRLGFGLWWVKTLMVRLGGTVSVASDGVSGTSFRLKLPRAGWPDA